MERFKKGIYGLWKMCLIGCSWTEPYDRYDRMLLRVARVVIVPEWREV